MQGAGRGREAKADASTAEVSKAGEKPGGELNQPCVKGWILGGRRAGGHAVRHKCLPNIARRDARVGRHVRAIDLRDQVGVLRAVPASREGRGAERRQKTSSGSAGNRWRRRTAM